MPPDTLYDTDFYAWTQQQAALLTAGNGRDLDFPHLAEEIEGLARSEYRALVRRLRRILAHLWKLQHGTPHDLERTGRGWRQTVHTQRGEVAELLHDNPSLGPRLPEALASAFRLARRDLADALLPEACPWTVVQVLDDTFWPEG
jgi:hypothetical protein